MKNYLYYFEFFSGFFESYFYKQVQAKNEKDAIIQCVSFLKNSDEAKTLRYINAKLGRNWSVNKFWNSMDLRFFSESEGVGSSLIWIKEVPFDLSKI